MSSEAELESLLGWFWTPSLMFDTPAVIFSYGTHVWVPVTVFIIPCSKEFILVYSTHAVTTDSQLHVRASSVCLILMTHTDVKKNKWRLSCHLSSGSGSAGVGGTWILASIRSRWLFPSNQIKSCFFLFHFSLRADLDLTEEQLRVIKPSSRHVGPKGRQINISYPCVGSKVTPLNTSYHPPLLHASLLLFQMALTDETIAELSLLTTCSAWSRELEATPHMHQNIPFLLDAQIFLSFAAGYKQHEIICSYLQLGWILMSCNIPSLFSILFLIYSALHLGLKRV